MSIINYDENSFASFVIKYSVSKLPNLWSRFKPFNKLLIKLKRTIGKYYLYDSILGGVGYSLLSFQVGLLISLSCQVLTVSY